MATTSSGGYTVLLSPPLTAQSHVSTCRPWRQFFSLTSLTRPYSLGETLLFVNLNLTYFRVNYTLISLVILFLSLLFHPISLIIFSITFLIWYALYFSRYHDLVILGRTINDRAVSIGLGVATVVVVGLTGVWLNVICSGVIAAVIVVSHACFRGTEDLYVEEQEAANNGGLVSVVGSPVRVSGHRQFL